MVFKYILLSLSHSLDTLHTDTQKDDMYVRRVYVDMAVEDSLQEEMLIVYLCFLVSL